MNFRDGYAQWIKTADYENTKNLSGGTNDRRMDSERHLEHQSIEPGVIECFNYEG